MPTYAQKLQQSASGMLLMAFFTTTWAGVAYFSLINSSFKWVLILFFMLILTLVVYAIRFFKTASRVQAQSSAPATAEEKQRSKRFFILFATEGLGIFIGINVVINLGYTNLIIPVIALVVGLHFLPMARVFKRKFDYYLGTWCVVVAICGIFFSLQRLFAPALITAFVSICMAMATSAYGLMMMIRGMHDHP